METKIDIEYGKKLARKWGFNYYERISYLGLSGGLLVFWDESLNVMIKSINKNIVNAYITDHHFNSFWISCLYGHLELHLRNLV